MNSGNGKNWTAIDEKTMRSRVYEFLDGAYVSMMKGVKARFQPSSYDVNRVLDALQAEANLEPERAMPGWLMGPAPVDNLKELVAVQNGLLHVSTRRLLKHSARFWSPNVLEFEYDPNVKAPRFTQFLEEVWPGDVGAQQGLLELIGLCITDETKYQKAFMFVGPKRGGRGTIGRVLRGLVGEDNYVGPRLRGMVKQFGMQSWIGKKVAIFPDVRTDGMGIDRLSSICEILLSVTGEDGIEIERKYVKSWNGKLSARVAMFSNELIKFQDDSGALPARFITWRMRQSFWGREDENLTTKLLAERPGILNLALDALDQLCERGCFVQPGSGEEMAEELQELASHVSLFVRERCVVGPEYEVSIEALYAEWKLWCIERGIRYFLEMNHFSHKVCAAFHTVTRGRPRKGNPSRLTWFRGIGIRAGM